ncbi:MAG TPA: type II toxin-antitoxin system HicA family toxin [Gemmatales bacterium]|nr:type II toxin-antitoxin system HicA family toxin [Gemmatales bacterium]HMP58418.1 type II toxin-antitoxin system HicA family toxin [Gemmatales bacterium]
MPRLSRVSQAEVKRAFEKAGFVLVRTKGSHHVLAKEGHQLLLCVPVHPGKTMGPGLLKDLINDAGLTVEEFIKLLK